MEHLANVCMSNFGNKDAAVGKGTDGRGIRSSTDLSLPSALSNLRILRLSGNKISKVGAETLLAALLPVITVDRSTPMSTLIPDKQANSNNSTPAATSASQQSSYPVHKHYHLPKLVELDMSLNSLRSDDILSLISLTMQGALRVSCICLGSSIYYYTWGGEQVRS
jgi:hypothetical protein